MHPPYHSPFLSRYVLVPVLLMVILILSCSAPVPRPTGPARDYDDAKDMFKRGRFDRALEFTDGLAKASPPTSFTERARVLRCVIFAGKVKSFKELAEAYSKGAETTKNAHFKAEYERQRHDNLLNGATAALGLAETAHQLVSDGTIPRELTLEASYPATEGPTEVRDLQRVKDGGWIEPDQQEGAALDSLRKGLDDALADAVAGDRSKARSALSSGSAKIDGVDFSLFLGKALVDAATLFDRKHGRDSMRLKTVCDEADVVAKAALALLKETPNKDKEKGVKALQDQIKKTLKNV